MTDGTITKISTKPALITEDIIAQEANQDLSIIICLERDSTSQSTIAMTAEDSKWALISEKAQQRTSTNALILAIKIEANSLLITARLKKQRVNAKTPRSDLVFIQSLKSYI